MCIALSVSFLSYIVSYVLYTPEYVSSTTFVVSAKGSSTGAYANQSKTLKLTETFQAVMDSQILKKKVADSLEMDSFPGKVSIAVVPETNLLTVSVTSGSPDISYKLLKSMLENYPEVGENVLGEVVMEVFEAPNYPTSASNSFDGQGIMKKTFILSAAVMILFLGVCSYMADTVKTENNIKQKLDTGVFAVLQHELRYRNLKTFFKRRKKMVLITEPSVSFGFVETIKKIRTKLLYKKSKDGCKLLLVTSVARQEGKTTLAANIALSMAQRSKNVLLIEGDLRKNSLAELLKAEIPDGKGMDEKNVREENLEELMFQLEGTSLFLLLNKESQRKSTEFLSSRKFEVFLRRMKGKMDYIIIDGPPAKGRADAEVLARLSDASLLVVKQNFTKVPLINDTIDMLNDYGSGVAGCVLNDVYASNSVISSGYGYGYGRYRYGRYYGYGKYQSYYNHRVEEKKEE